jgi:hypothetical protein
MIAPVVEIHHFRLNSATNIAQSIKGFKGAR